MYVCIYYFQQPSVPGASTCCLTGTNDFDPSGAFKSIVSNGF